MTQEWLTLNENGPFYFLDILQQDQSSNYHHITMSSGPGPAEYVEYPIIWKC